MPLLEHPDDQASLADAALAPEQVEGRAARIEPLLARYLPLFRRSQQRDDARLILWGKPSAWSRQTCEPIAHSFGVRREGLQDFAGASPWADRPLLDELRCHVAQEWGDPRGALIGDGSGSPEKGEHSCGVKRQYCGRLGQVGNGQLGIFVGYACRHGHTLLGHRLSLPAGWAPDPGERAKAGVPGGGLPRALGDAVRRVGAVPGRAARLAHLRLGVGGGRRGKPRAGSKRVARGI